MFWRVLLFCLIAGTAGAGAGWWFFGPAENWPDVVGRLLSGRQVHTLHPLPNLGWSGWLMVGSGSLLVALVLLLRGKNSRINLLQRCLIVSVLVHASVCFAMSFVVVSQHVNQYVKHEAGFDLALTLPKGLEVAMALRNPRSSEGPEASLPRDLSPRAKLEFPGKPVARPANIPLDDTASGTGSHRSLLPPAIIAAAPAAPALPMPVPTPPAVTPVLSPPAAVTIPVPVSAQLHQQEIQPEVTADGPGALLRSGLASPSAGRGEKGLALDSGSESAKLPPAMLATPAPLPTPMLPGPAIGGPTAAILAVPAPVVSPPVLGVNKVGSQATSPLAGAQPGQGEDANLGRLVDNDTGNGNTRFVPARSGPVDLPGTAASDVNSSFDSSRPLPIAVPVAPSVPIQIARANSAGELIAPNVPMVPPPMVLPPELRKVIPVTPFQRAPDKRQLRVQQFGGNSASEQAVDRALKFLARQQEPDGRWTHVGELSSPGKRAYTAHDMAYTGLALLTFLARNHSPFEAGPYRETVRRGLNYLLSNQSPDGDLRGPPEFRGGASQQANLYDHAIATLAISECAALTGDQRLASSARAAAQFIVDSQDPVGGGWRYAKGESGDTSVFGWQIMALHSVELLGFAIPDSTRKAARHYIDTACAGPGSMYASYQPGVDVTQTMTSEMVFARFLLGEHFSQEQVRTASEFLSQYPPDASRPDLYCWYYASLCMMTTGSPSWAQWNAQTRDALVQLQTRGGFGDGCWEINAKGIDRSGYIFTTAIATLTLEVYYRYAPGVISPSR